MNLIECQFQALRRFALDGSDHASHAEQDAAIHAYVRWLLPTTCLTGLDKFRGVRLPMVRW